MVVVQAGLAEWGAGRMAIAWSDPRADAPDVARGREAGAVGAALGVGCAGARRDRRDRPSRRRRRGGGAGDGAAARRAVRGGAGRGARRAAPARRGAPRHAAASGRARRWSPAASRPPLRASGWTGRSRWRLIPEALRGAALGALWVRDRGAWMACAANAAWTWTTGPGPRRQPARRPLRKRGDLRRVLDCRCSRSRAVAACLWATGRWPGRGRAS